MDIKLDISHVKIFKSGCHGRLNNFTHPTVKYRLSPSALPLLSNLIDQIASGSQHDKSKNSKLRDRGKCTEQSQRQNTKKYDFKSPKIDSHFTTFLSTGFSLSQYICFVNNCFEIYVL